MSSARSEPDWRTRDMQRWRLETVRSFVEVNLVVIHRTVIEGMSIALMGTVLGCFERYSRRQERKVRLASYVARQEKSHEERIPLIGSDLTVAILGVSYSSSHY